ncbi:MAG: ATP synthase F1 subunit gamma [Acidobacteria bacterium]|nr:ATP synthase F1 subunit gamma [Acidobacteriota bacterium]MCB9396402.1 ATP synthase F1 subunit gamma [Acidobacteriota bacterium]
MPSLLDIRRRIKSVKNTQKITKAIKMVAASRLRRASEMAVEARPYVNGLERVHNSITRRMSEINDPLYQSQSGKTLLVVISADKGLCGSFNANVLKASLRFIRKNGIENTAILPIGKKALGFFKRSQCEVLPGMVDLFRNLNSAAAEPLAHKLTQAYREGKFSEIVIIYNAFKNILVQEVTTSRLLPLSAEHGEDDSSAVEHLTEPSLEAIISEMAPKLIVTKVFQALMESNAAEQAAKMTAMDAATNNASDMIEKLTLEMNKARQAAITKELIEIVSGAAAL